VTRGGRLRAGVLAGAFVAAGVTAATPAPAVEREHHLGVDLGASMLVVSDKGSPDLGPMVGAHWTYGLTDAFNLMVEGSWSLLALNENVVNKSTPLTRPEWGANADVGLAYVFDVLRWVPYAGLLAGGYTLGGGTIQGTKVLGGAAIALGLGYRVSRSLSVGVSARQHMLTDANTYPSYTQLFGQLEYTWGW
jgi:hypothetical protein